jgi:penicillin amidase
VAERTRHLLAAWDGEMSRDRVEPSIYEAFMRRLLEEALRPVAGDLWGVASGESLHHDVFEYPGNLAGRATPWLIERWETDDTSLIPEDSTWDELVERALLAALADLRAAHGRRRRRWRWGRVHALVLRHPFAERRPLGLLFNAGRIRVGGSLDTVMATSPRPGAGLATALFAPSWRQVIDVGDWDACTGVHYPGQSGQVGSRHRRDLIGRWRDNRQYPMFWSLDAVNRNARQRLTLFPSPAAEAATPEAAAAAA